MPAIVPARARAVNCAPTANSPPFSSDGKKAIAAISTPPIVSARMAKVAPMPLQ